MPLTLKQLAKLRVPRSRDSFSQMSLEQLSNMVPDTLLWRFYRECLPDRILAVALRWKLRGLSFRSAVRKAKMETKK